MSRHNDGRVRLALVCVATAVLVAGVIGALSAAGLGAGPDYGVQATYRMGEVYASPVDDDRTTGSVALDSSEQDYTLPSVTNGASMMYTEICAYGNDAYILCGEAPVAATTAAGGYAFRVAAGTCWGPRRLTGPVCSHIATSAAGHIVFIHYDQSL